MEPHCMQRLKEPHVAHELQIGHLYNVTKEWTISDIFSITVG